MYGQFAISDMKGLAGLAKLAKDANINSVSDAVDKYNSDNAAAAASYAKNMKEMAQRKIDGAKALSAQADLQKQMMEHTPQDISRLLSDATKTIKSAKQVLKK